MGQGSHSEFMSFVGPTLLRPGNPPTSPFLLSHHTSISANHFPRATPTDPRQGHNLGVLDLMQLESNLIFGLTLTIIFNIFIGLRFDKDNVVAILIFI